jgi:membrane-bound lytic murein transglycosylase MltF
VGLMQLMPAAAERFGCHDRNDPAENGRHQIPQLAVETVLRKRRTGTRRIQRR